MLAAAAGHGASSFGSEQDCTSAVVGAGAVEWPIAGSLAFEGAFDWQSCLVSQTGVVGLAT